MWKLFRVGAGHIYGSLLHHRRELVLRGNDKNWIYNWYFKRWDAHLLNFSKFSPGILDPLNMSLKTTIKEKVGKHFTSVRLSKISDLRSDQNKSNEILLTLTLTGSFPKKKNNAFWHYIIVLFYPVLTNTNVKCQGISNLLNKFQKRYVKLTFHDLSCLPQSI